MEFIYECPAFNDDGIKLVNWVASTTSICVYHDDPLTAISQTAGYVSFICWLGAQLPQVVVNYLNGSVEGLSLGFLLNWFAGDTTNFLGCILTGQMPFQIVLGVYNMVIDCILGTQYYYYSRLDKKRHERHRRIYYDEHLDYYHDAEGAPAPCDQPAESRPVEVPNRNGSGGGGGGGNSSSKLLTSSFVASFAKLASGAPIGVKSQGGEQNYTILIGQGVAWCCTFLYLSSRIPQIIKNYRRQSTWGISMLLFFSAFMGNVTYTISILTSPQARGEQGREFLLNELPYIIGAAGTVGFDMTIFVQRWYYGNVHTHPDSPQQQPQQPEQASIHHAYPDGSLIPPLNSKTAFKDDDASTPLAMSLQSNYSSV